MEQKTFLRELRDRHGISLPALEKASKLSLQYINRVEMGYIKPSARLEDRIDLAVEQIIVERGRALAALESDYQLWKGGLLLPYRE